MNGKDKIYVPPAPVGEPFRGRPDDAPPFLTDTDRVPVVPAAPAVPVEAVPVAPPEGLPKHEDDAPRTEYGAPPMFQPQQKATASKAAALTPEARFARTAVWVGIASIFIFNIFFGPAAVIMGIVATRRGERQQGRRAIILGAVGTLVGIVALALSLAGVLPSIDQMWNDFRKRR